MDDLEHALMKTRALVEEAVELKRAWSRDIQLATCAMADGQAIGEALREMAGRTRDSIDAVIALDRRESNIEQSAIDEILSHAAEDVPIRILCTGRGAERRFPMGGYRYGKSRIEIRRLAIQPLETMIIDDRLSVLWVDAKEDPHVLINSNVFVARALRSLFDSAWRNAVPVTLEQRLPEGYGEEFAKQALSLTYAGITDEVAARKLGVSSRTYRRVMAGILESLSAKTRFQAGVLAMEAGLLSPAGMR